MAHLMNIFSRVAYLCVFVLFTISSLNQANAMLNQEIKFTAPSELENWVVINDTVMGGRSQASLNIANGKLTFKGELSLQNNGGFASARRVYNVVPWQNDKPISITVQGDGRKYQFRLRTNRNVDGMAYVAHFQTEADKTQTFTFSSEDFSPQYRGRAIMNAPTLKFIDIEQLGFMLADKHAGPFELLLQDIVQLGPVA